MILYPDFRQARFKAYKLLRYQKTLNLKIVASELLFSDKTVYFDTFQNYSKITGKGVNELTSNNKLDEGYTIIVSAYKYIVLHSGNCKDPLHLNWTNAHEIGHIEMRHTTDGPLEEIEANFFAACLLMPDAVISHYYKIGYDIDHYFLYDAFNVSYTAACKKIHSLNRFTGIPKTPLDSDVINVFQRDISSHKGPYSIYISK